jgi:hypothetical protein
MAILTVAVYFTRNTGIPATGLALGDIDLYLTEQDIATSADTVIWNGAQNPTEEIDNIGAYTRRYDVADFDNNNYYARGTYTGAVALDVDHVTGDYPCVNPWAFDVRTLSASASATLAAVEGSVISQPRATTWDFTITGLGDITLRTDLYFSIKRRTLDPDANSVIQIEETAGLLVVNGAAPAAAGNGSITVTNAVLGNVDIEVAAIETEKLRPIDNLQYDFKMVTVNAVTLLTLNRFNVTDLVTGAIT